MPKDLRLLGAESVKAGGQLPYFKVPRLLKKLYGSPIHWPEPSEVNMKVDDRHVSVVFKFDKDKMESLKRK